ncbi:MULTISPECIES: hypothetical protein [Bacteroides]|uniref:hypothetical protein n=1 Tax=Bacteroides TaxID=816 RepID=UPI001FB4CCCD|nr:MULTISPECIES: hypothetical protein [Bacteroides]
MPCQSIPVNGKLLAGCAGRRSLPESRERPFPKARRYGREKYMGARSGFGCRTNAGELFRAGRGTGSFGEQPKPRVAARTDVFRLSFRPMSGFGHAASRNGRKQTPGRDSPCAKVQAQDSESPFTHVRDCRGKPTA